MQDNIFPLIQKPSRVTTSSHVANTYIIKVWEDIGDPLEWSEELDVINSATEFDTIVLDICSRGGDLDTAMLFHRSLKATPAHSVAVIGPTCASAASVFALSCKEWVLDGTSSLMAHTSSYMIGGKDTDILEHANFSRKQLVRFFEDVYSGFLNPEDISDVIKGTPFYFDADQLAERLDNLTEYRQSKPCECEHCCGSMEDEEGELEEMPTLQEMLKAAVREALSEQKAEDEKKAKAAEKRSQRKPSKKLEKVLDEAKEISEYLSQEE